MEDSSGSTEKEPKRLLQQPYEPKLQWPRRPSFRDRLRWLSMIKKHGYPPHPGSFHPPPPMPPSATMIPLVDESTPCPMPGHYQGQGCYCACHAYTPHLAPMAPLSSAYLPMFLVPAMHLYPPWQVAPFPCGQPPHGLYPHHPHVPAAAPSYPLQTMSCPTTPTQNHAPAPCMYPHYVKDEKRLVECRSRHPTYDEEEEDDSSSLDDNETLRSASSHCL